MKKIKVTFILILLFNLLHAQSPLVKQWDKRFGGTLEDLLYSLQQTSDSGYILGGRSFSDIGGDKTQPSWGGADYWIVKIDSVGNKQWDKRFGGIDYDEFNILQQTSDGGYILGGHSWSSISGDKTQLNWGGNDYWIVKIDSVGNKQWDKRFGGTSIDECYYLQQTIDGGYILGGGSQSGIGGDKTQPSWGANDYWIVKIDSVGNKQWDKDFGGINDERLLSVNQTYDGGFILGGWSLSGVGGDKTQPSWGAKDYWIVKTDAFGNKQWDKRFGGTGYDIFYSLQQTTDGGYILGGLSASGVGGDKTQPSWGANDYWIVKIDSLGNKQWDKRFGGIDIQDEFGNITQTPDGGYLLSGLSYSNISGDKTENNLGVEQSWIVKTDSLGIKQWDKTIFTAGHDENSYAVRTNEGCYVIAVMTDGGIGGYKTQPNWDSIPQISNDYWIIKFCDSTITTNISSLLKEKEVIVFPNPFASEISISIQKKNSKQVTFIIKNILGQTVFTKQENNLTTYTKTMDLRFLSKGIYLLDIFIDGERTVKKIVKE